MKVKPNCSSRNIEHGIIYIKDLLDITGGTYNILNHNTFCTRYAVTINYLDYMGLTNSIPRIWKVKLNALELDIPANKTTNRQIIENIKNAEKATAMIYREIMSNRNVIKNSEQKWEELMNINIEWKKVYTASYKATIDVRLQEFQFKILHRILPTNKALHLWNLSDTDKCYFCTDNIETITHLFYECQIIHAFWEEVCDLLQPCIDIRPALNLRNVILGTDFEDNHTINYVMLMVKRYIYVTKCKNEMLSIISFKNTVKMNRETEIFISISENTKRNQLLQMKWEILHNMF